MPQVGFDETQQRCMDIIRPCSSSEATALIKGDPKLFYKQGCFLHYLHPALHGSDRES